MSFMAARPDASSGFGARNSANAEKTGVHDRDYPEDV